jgi:hypothetical protein
VLRWFAEDATRTSSAARSAAGSARWRSSISCKRPTPHGRGVHGCMQRERTEVLGGTTSRMYL